MPNSSRVGGIAVSCLTLAGVIGCQILGVKRSDDTNAQPERSPDAGAGARAAPDVAFLAEFNMRMPDELMNNTRTRDAARACAVAINNALSAGRQCDSWNGMAKGVEAGTAAAAIASTAMSSQVSPVAKQHWVWAAIGLGAAFGVMSQVDTWLNCSDRTFRQAQLAALRISHLLNAAHLGSCARHTTEQSRLPAAEAIAAQALDAGASRDLIRQALTGTPAEAVAALREAEKQSNASEATKKQAADVYRASKRRSRQHQWERMGA